MPKIRKRRTRTNPVVETQADRERWVEEDQTREIYTSAEMALLEGRRTDINEFCAYVGRDAETGERITQEPIHETFQALADHYRRLILMAHPESGKTTQIGILRSLFLLGNNHNLRIAVVSKIEKNAVKTTRAIREYIEKSPELHDVFPDLRRGAQWEDAAFMIDRDTFSKDPTVQAVGLNGSIIGSRVDVLILDDVLDALNTDNPAAMKKAHKLIRAMLSRVTKDGVVLFLTNAWHPEDSAHKFARESGWEMRKFPVRDKEGNLTWPAKWPQERIDREADELGPTEAARSLFCEPRGEGENPFDMDALESAFGGEALELSLVHHMSLFDTDENGDPAWPEGTAIIHGVDLAVSKTSSSHFTAIVTIFLWPEDWSRQLLWIEAGRWSSRDIRDHILDHARRYPGSFFVVENNAAQRWILDIVENQLDLPVNERIMPDIVPFTTGRNKAHPEFGVEGVAVEITRGKWLFPTNGPGEIVKQVAELRTEMEFYSRGAHTGDRLMGLWFAREGARRGRLAGTAEKPKEEKDLAPAEFGNVHGVSAKVFT